MKIIEVEAKSVLNRSKIWDYCVNPYTGCAVGCPYCYARMFIPRYSGHSEGWGSFVDIKVNAPNILEKQLNRASPGKVWLSSVCDPYQPLEKKFGITRRCLEALLKSRFPVIIQTKSALVLRDIDLFKEFSDIEIGLTITTDDEMISRRFEPGASSVRARLDALAELKEKGLRTYVFIGPILPADPENLVKELAGKADRAYVDRMNYIKSLRSLYRRSDMMSASSPDFFNAFRLRYRKALESAGIPAEILF